MILIILNIDDDSICTGSNLREMQNRSRCAMRNKRIEYCCLNCYHCLCMQSRKGSTENRKVTMTTAVNGENKHSSKTC